MSEPERLDEFIAVLDAPPEQLEHVEHIQSEYRRMDERIAVLKERLESRRKLATSRLHKHTNGR